MQTIDGKLVYSATDLVGFLACGHLTNLDRATIADHLKVPIRKDADLERIGMRGLQHELTRAGRAARTVDAHATWGRRHLPGDPLR